MSDLKPTTAEDRKTLAGVAAHVLSEQFTGVGMHDYGSARLLAQYIPILIADVERLQSALDGRRHPAEDAQDGAPYEALRAQVARVTKERDEWRDYWGGDSPHDSHITIGSLNPYARQLGNEQARANTAENRLAALKQERDEANTVLANEMRAHTGTLDTLDALRQENAELKVDRDRMDWLEEQDVTAIREECGLARRGNGSLRAAIDAARAEGDR